MTESNAEITNVRPKKPVSSFSKNTKFCWTVDSKRLNQTELLQRGFWEGGLEQLLLSHPPRREAEAGRGGQEDLLTDPEAWILRRSTHLLAVQTDSPNATASLPRQLPQDLYSNAEDLAAVSIASQQNS